MLESTALHVRDSLPKVVANKVFDHSDQIAFARLSHDWNPMHTDPVQARRFMSGAQVVHGVNLLLTAINAAVRTDVRLDAISRVACDFKVAVNIGEEITVILFENDTDRAVIHVMLGNVICTKITLYFAVGYSLKSSDFSTDTLARSDSSFLSLPVDLSEHAYRDFSAEVYLGSAADVDFGSMYPHLISQYGAFFCLAFSRLSYIVGMVCPGLNSIFLSLDVTVPENWAMEQYLKFRVSKFEDRIKLLELALESGFLTGQIKAFRRPSPVEQPDVAEIEPYIQADEFKHVQSFVIGGSRGLGELTSKIVCAGGGKVILGYAVGEADAARVRSDIEKSWPGSCRIQQFDIKNDISSDLMNSLEEIDSVYYFPTPQISKKINAVFSQEIFENLLEYYVFAFYRLCSQLEKRAKNKIKIYYPSSIFVDDRPNGMTEYAMAKAAAELMINDINRTFLYVKIYCTRLPRLKSDQTNSIFQAKTGENLTHLLSIAREMHGL